MIRIQKNTRSQANVTKIKNRQTHITISVKFYYIVKMLIDVFPLNVQTFFNLELKSQHFISNADRLDHLIFAVADLRYRPLLEFPPIFPPLSTLDCTQYKYVHTHIHKAHAHLYWHTNTRIVKSHGQITEDCTCMVVNFLLILFVIVSFIMYKSCLRSFLEHALTNISW